MIPLILEMIPFPGLVVFFGKCFLGLGREGNGLNRGEKNTTVKYKVH
jgi:hypothetical protein